MSQEARRQGDVVIAAAVGVAAVLIALLRLPASALDTVWAEDGSIFIQGALRGMPLETLFAPYQGYLQFVPRILADIATLFGVPHAAVALTLEVCVVTGGLAAVVYICARTVVPSRPLRVILALLTVLVPTIPIEILGTAANVHSIFLWATPWLLLARPRSRTGLWLLAAVMLVGALSEIQLLLFLPLVFVDLRRRSGWPIRAAYLVGLVAQLISTLLAPRAAQTATHPPNALSIGKNFLSQVLLPIFAPRGVILDFFVYHGLLFWGLIALLPFVVALVVVLRRGAARQKIAAIAFFAAAPILWTVDVYLNHFGSGPPPPAAFIFTRYGVVPAMLLLAVVVVAAQVLLDSPRRARLAIPGVVLAGALVVVLAAGFVPDENLRSHGPDWRASIAAAAKSCSAHPARTMVEIGIAPIPQPGGWAVDVRCASLK